MSDFSNVAETPSTGEARDHDDIVVDDTAGGVVLLAANRGRKSALVINTGDFTMRVTTDGSDPTPTHGKRIGAGEALTLSSPYCPTKEIKACRQEATDTTANASEVD